MAVHEAVVAQPQELAALRPVDRHRLDDDEPGLALRKPDVPVDDVLVDEPVLAGEAGDHRGKDDAVVEPHRVDPDGLEQLHFKTFAAMTSFRMSLAPS